MNWLRFSKMQALGNDFVVFDAVRQRVSLAPDQVRRLAHRRFGIGCDQVLLVAPPSRPEADFDYVIYNADGGEVAQCGNGARCFMVFVHEQGLSARREITVATRAGLLRPRLEQDGSVSVDLGEPRFEPAAVPFVAETRRDEYDLDLDGEILRVQVLSLGNPHAVQWVADVDRAPVAAQGPRIEHHPRFPQRTNAVFAQWLDRGHLKVRVWERGAGETLACGSGASAAVVAGRVAGRLDESVRVDLPGGALQVYWPGLGAPVRLSGPAASVFEGRVDLDRLAGPDLRRDG